MIEKIIETKKRISNFIVETPFIEFYNLNKYFGDKVNLFFKIEIFQPTKSYKVRNAFSVITGLNAYEKVKGVVVASTGNLGMAFAYAGAKLNVPVVICLKQGANPIKINAIKEFGAKIIESGNSYDDALKVAKEISGAENITLARSADNENAYLGAATLGYEMFMSGNYLHEIYFAVACGAQAAGGGMVRNELKIDTKIIGVQAENASAVHDSWHAGMEVKPPFQHTIADGIAISGDDIAPSLNILKNTIDDFKLVTENEIIEAGKILFKKANLIAEPAAVVGLAAVMKNIDNLSGKRIGLCLTGGNIDEKTFYKFIS